MKEFVCKTRSGKSVYIDHEATKVGLHLTEAPQLLQLVKEVLTIRDVEGENVALEVDLGRIVGETSLIETTDDDEIVYARRLQRDKYTRFVKNKELMPTSWVTVILHKVDDGYNLWSAWCGKLVPTSPGGEDEMPKSQGYWRNHALVYDADIIQADTVTEVCPWE
jgi:hypothetical protein